MNEEARRGRLSELADHYADGALGEITVVVEGATEAPAAIEEAEVDAEIRARIDAGERPRDIAAALAGPTGRAKRDLYARALALRPEDA